MLRQRITLFNPLDTNSDVISDATSSSISIEPPVEFEREDKFTLEDIDLQFKHVDQLRIQMIKEKTRSSVFNFYYDKGLSIYTSPKNLTNADDVQAYFDEVNKFVGDLFQLELTNSSWIPSHNSLNFYTNEYTDGFTKYINNELKHIKLPDATGIDWFFNGNNVVVKSISTFKKRLVINKEENINKEVGLFISDKSISTKDDIVLSGVRAVFKNDTEDEYLFKTLFHVKPRHRQLNIKYDSKILENGLHPILRSEFNDTISYPEDADLKECRLYYYLKLNRSLFLDKYQLNPNQNLLFKLGSSDLELPEYGIQSWGNEILIELNSTSDIIDLNLHSRYQHPNIQGYKRISLNNPHVFIGCDVIEEELLENSPFENKLSIGGDYERFFTNDTVFYHFQSQDDKLYVDIPSGSTDISKINNITIISLFAGLLLIGFKLFKVFKKTTNVTSTKKNE